MKVWVTLQPAAYTDNIWAIGDELVEGTKLPYPFHVTEDGSIERQDFWRGDVYKVIGFTTSPERRRIDLYWPDVWMEPSKAVGMYLVTTDGAGTWSTHQTAIESAETRIIGGEGT